MASGCLSNDEAGIWASKEKGVVKVLAAQQTRKRGHVYDEWCFLTSSGRTPDQDSK